MKYKSKLKRNSKYNPNSKRFQEKLARENIVSLENCQEKVAYKTVNLAYKGKRLAEKYGHIMEVYKCPHCKKYHLTKLGEME